MTIEEYHRRRAEIEEEEYQARKAAREAKKALEAEHAPKDTEETKEKPTRAKKTAKKSDHKADGRKKGNSHTLRKDADVLSTGANPAPIIYPSNIEKVTDAGKPSIEEIKARIDDAIEEYKDEAERRAGFDRKKPIEADTWMAICRYVGLKVFDGKKLLQEEKAERGNNPPFNLDRVQAIYNYYAYLTSLTRAVVRVCDFEYFISTSYKALNTSPALTSASGSFAKKIVKESENAYAAKLASRSANTTGIAMILNVRYGWTQSREVVHTDGTRKLTAAELPKLGTNGDN